MHFNLVLELLQTQKLCVFAPLRVKELLRKNFF